MTLITWHTSVGKFLTYPPGEEIAPARILELNEGITDPDALHWIPSLEENSIDSMMTFTRYFKDSNGTVMQMTTEIPESEIHAVTEVSKFEGELED